MKKIKLIIVSILLAVVCVSGYKIIQFKKASVLATKIYEEIIDDVVKTDSNNSFPIDFDRLLDINSDVVGWIKLDETIIDYPVVQCSDNEYYTTHDINKIEEAHAAIFMDYMNKVDLSNHHTIIYGHNKKDGTMFNTLQKYVKEKDFYDTHRELEYYSLDKYYKLKVFSAYNPHSSSSAYQINFENAEEYQNWLNELCSLSVIDTEIKPKITDRIVTLSTCAFNFTEARYVIHCIVEEQ